MTPPRRKKVNVDELARRLGVARDATATRPVVRNRAGEVRRSFAFNYPRLAGLAEGAGNVAKGVVNFIPDVLRGLSSFTPEELRDPAVRKQITDNGWGDPDQMLHEAIKARARGEPVGSTEYATSLLRGMGEMGFHLQRAIQGGALYEQTEPGKLSFRATNPDVTPRERARAITEMLGNTGLLAAGVENKALPVSRLPLSAAGRAAAALRDAVGPTAVLPTDWTATSGSQGARVRGGRGTAAGNLNLEVPTFMREKFTQRQSPIDNLSLERPTFQRRAALADIRRQFNQMVGGDEPLPRIDKVDEGAATRMAETYEKLESNPNDPAVREAYEAFNHETQAQAEALRRAGYTWEFVTEDPYPPSKGGSKAMLRDLRERHHIKVYRTTGEQSHPLMTNEQNNLFRAVHEIMGHGIDNVPFSAKGEELAYRSHAQAYSPKARRVMATETRGQNSQFNYGPNRHIPAPQRPFAAQKAALWPEEMMGDYSSFPKADAPAWNRSPALQQAMDRGMITPERMVPSVKGADGEYYTGINHEDASAFAAERFRESPKWKNTPPAERDWQTPVVEPGSEGFRLNSGEYVSRERAGQEARSQGLVPNLAKEWTQLHSSDINNPGNFAGEYAVPKDLIDAARGAPSIIMRGENLFDPNVGAPGLSQMIRQYGRPESGSILDYVAPGTYLRDVPQTLFDLPSPKNAGEFAGRYSDARAILNLDNPFIVDALQRGVEMGYPDWYNAEPILGSAMKELGSDLGLDRFRALMNYMKPTSVQTEPLRNLRNASYQFWRGGNPGAPLFAEGYRPIYPTDMTRFLQQLEEGGGHMTQPKLEPYGEAFMGNWRTAAGDTHFHRALEALGIPYGAKADPGVGWGPYHSAFTDLALEAQGEGIIPDVPGRSPVSPTQASMWGGMGRQTGVANIESARPSIWQMFEDATHRSARHLGMDPNEFLGRFWRREVPLF